MKYYPGCLLVMLTVFSPFALMAQEKVDNVTIIDGKRFIPLRGARHFYGTSKPIPVVTNKNVRNPLAMTPVTKTPPAVEKPLVVEKPKMETLPTEANNKVVDSVYAPATRLHKTENPASEVKNDPASRVLSIFTPDDKAYFQPPAQ